MSKTERRAALRRETITHKPKTTENNPEQPKENKNNLDVDVNVDVNVDGDVDVDDIGAKAPEPSGSPPPKRARFIKPTVDEVRAYCAERKNNIDPQHFWDYYEARGWKVGGRTVMKDWRAAVRTWENNNFATSPPKKQGMDGDQSQQSKARALVESWKTGVYA